MGWFWYLGTLVPVIGLIQVGAQAMADRYTYLPMIGISIMLVWGVAELAAKSSRVASADRRRGGLAAGGLDRAVRPVRSPTGRTASPCFSTRLKPRSDNYFAYNHLGLAYQYRRGRSEEGRSRLYRRRWRLRRATMRRMRISARTMPTAGVRQGPARTFRPRSTSTGTMRAIATIWDTIYMALGNLDDGRGRISQGDRARAEAISTVTGAWS